MFDENLLSSLSQGAGMNDIISDHIPTTTKRNQGQEKLFRSTSCKDTTPNLFEMQNRRSFESATNGGGMIGYGYHHTSLDSYNQGKIFNMMF